MEVCHEERCCLLKVREKVVVIRRVFNAGFKSSITFIVDRIDVRIDDFVKRNVVVSMKMLYAFVVDSIVSSKSHNE